jgi:AraC family transcriptional regulator, regulatory protein of adaptative response / methylated-DNA-[protein]-cysteine methyltransferase
MLQYELISKVINQLTTSKSDSLETLSKQFGYNKDYLQKKFTEYVGVSPKQFGQYLSLQYAKHLLAENKNHLQTSSELGFSSTSRLHDVFVTIEAMTPGEYMNGNVKIDYNVKKCIFGFVLVATTQKGVCNVLFGDTKELVIRELFDRWQHGKLIAHQNQFQKPVFDYLINRTPSKIKCHLHGTNYQLKVWEALLSIPSGELTSYGEIAKQIGTPQDSRAVGTAVGQNPVGLIIPCHRVLKSTGQISGYRWGVARKQFILGMEAVRKNSL